MDKIDKLYKDANMIAEEMGDDNGCIILITQTDKKKTRMLYGGDGVEILTAVSDLLIKACDDMDIPYARMRQTFDAIFNYAAESDRFIVVRDLDE